MKNYIRYYRSRGAVSLKSKKIISSIQIILLVFIFIGVIKFDLNYKSFIFLVMAMIFNQVKDSNKWLDTGVMLLTIASIFILFS